MRHRFGFVLIATMLAIAAACGKESTETTTGAGKAELGDTTLDACVINQGTTAPAQGNGGAFTTLKPGRLLVGSDTAFPPFESIENGVAVGFDVDLIKEIAKRLDPPLNVEVQTAVFDTIFTSLAAKKFDVVLSAVTIKEDRKKTVDFTDPYFKSDLSLSVRESDAGSIKGVEDLTGKTVGVQAGTTSEDCAKNALQKAGKLKDVRAYDTIPDAFTDLSAGRVDGVIIDLPTAQQIVEQRTGIRVVQVIRTKEEYGIAVGKDNPNLRVAINDALKKVKDDGTYRRIFVKWFKTEPPA
jgi:polar amino acid transport system substrate-binding protein